MISSLYYPVQRKENALPYLEIYRCDKLEYQIYCYSTHKYPLQIYSMDACLYHQKDPPLYKVDSLQSLYR